MATVRVVRPAGLLALACAVVFALPTGAAAEQASEPSSPVAGQLDAGGYHSCAVLGAGGVRCWGYGADGQLGYGNTDTIGDDEPPASVGPVNLGAGRTAKAIAAGTHHTCAILDGGTVRCWGLGGDGRLGYGNTNNVSDPASVGPVGLGTGRTAKAITAGTAHTCAILDNGSVRCWGFGGGGHQVGDGRLGYGSNENVGDNETPGSVAPVKLGTGRKAVAISAGGAHTCALLDDGTVSCWGLNESGQLGYGNTATVGDNPTDTPDIAGPVNLGGHRATAISAGGGRAGGTGFVTTGDHTCALLNDGSVRCWGYGLDGQLGYANTNNVGDTPTSTPATAGPVALGSGRTTKAISAGDADTCAILDDGTLRCWGLGVRGRLGYPTLDSLGNQDNIGDDETPASVGPVDLGSGRTAVAISGGKDHTCARLDDSSVRCWGYGAEGQLGYCSTNTIGDDEAPGTAGPVNLQPGDGGLGCPSSPSGGSSSVTLANAQSTGQTVALVNPDAARGRSLRSCLAAVRNQARRERSLARHGSPRQRAKARRRLVRSAATGRRRCLNLYGRTPGAIIGLRASTYSDSEIKLDFKAPGTDRNHPPPASSYVVKQSRRPIRNARDFTRAQALCAGSCRFRVTKVGDTVSLVVEDLRPQTIYYYALAARDNVTGRCGPRSKTVKARTDKIPPDPGAGQHHHGGPHLPNRRAASCHALR